MMFNYYTARENLTRLMEKYIPFVWWGMAFGIIGTYEGTWQGLADKLNANCGIMCTVSAQQAFELYDAYRLTCDELPQPTQFDYSKLASRLVKPKEE